MIDEPFHEEIDENGDQPTTQKDLATWGGQLTQRINELEAATKAELKKQTDELKDFIRTELEGAVENRFLDLGAAKKEKAELVEQKVRNLEHRVSAIEQHKT